jgi:Flp pilus assembly protein TadD
MSWPSRPGRIARLLGSAALAATLAAAVSGCQTVATTETTGAVAPASGAPSEADWRREVDAAAAAYRASPRDPGAGIRYARALRVIGQRSQATAVLEQCAIHNPKDRAVLGAYGRALADNGNYAQALEVLGRAHSPDQPDWRILSVQGTALDQLGRHDEAQRYYASALRLVPDEPTVLSNLGLSYALAKDLKRAETTLRHAADVGGANAKVRQNLALVVGLQGRFEEAERIAQADLPPEEAAANVAYLRQMLAQPSKLKNIGGPAVPAPSRQSASWFEDTPRASP